METIEWVGQRDLNVGDVVRLACGGPEMVVGGYTELTVSVLWTVGGELRRADVPAAVLRIKVATEVTAVIERGHYPSGTSAL